MAELVFNKVFSKPAQKEKIEKKFQATRKVNQVKKMTVEEIITEFPKLAKSGEFVQAMVTSRGHNRGRTIYAIINKVINQSFSNQMR